MNGMQVHAARALEALKSLLALVGVAGLALYFLLPLKPALQSLVPIEAVAADEVTVIPVAVVESPLEREQRLVAEHIAKRYRIADAAASHFVSVAYRAAEQYRVVKLGGSHPARFDQFAIQRPELESPSQVCHLIQRRVDGRAPDFTFRIRALVADAVHEEIDGLLRRPTPQVVIE